MMPRTITRYAMFGAVLCATTALASAQSNYSDWDANSDHGIDTQEWNTGWGQNGVFDRFDADHDRALSREELDRGVAAGQTGASTAEGAPSGFQHRFGENAFTDWDSDKSGSLTRDEFDAGVFKGYDRDHSGVIEEPEFGDYGDDIGDGGFWDV